jgi:hypothetical protein
MIIIDFETLGNGQERDDFIIVDVSWLHFDLKQTFTFDDLVSKARRIKFDINEQFELGWRAEHDTLEWWKKQDKEAVKNIKPSSEDQSLSEFIEKFNADLKRYSPKYLWSRGNDFDLPILKRIYRTMGDNINNKIPFNSASDVRTALRVASNFTLKWDGFIPPTGKNVNYIKHDSKHDIAMDVLRLQYLLGTD